MLKKIKIDSQIKNKTKEKVLCHYVVGVNERVRSQFIWWHAANDKKWCKILSSRCVHSILHHITEVYCIVQYASGAVPRRKTRKTWIACMDSEKCAAYELINNAITQSVAQADSKSNDWQTENENKNKNNQKQLQIPYANGD